ncbi:hypothetical protein QQP08_005300 [Theobroma cacao]|nr:hypothetical protein QQP08_005300 [Theobroma cacao]
MENKSQVCGSSSSSSYSSSSSLSSSSSSVSFDHLFGPKDSSSSSSTSGIFGTIFPPPSTVLGRDSSHSGMMGSWNNQGLPHHGKYGNPGNVEFFDIKQNHIFGVKLLMIGLRPAFTGFSSN